MMARRRFRTNVIAAIAVVALVATACGPEEEPEDEGAATVEVTLQEFSVVPSATSAPLGEVTFDVTNSGPEDIHEFVVFATDLAPDALPTNADGSVDETGAGVELIGEIEDIAVGDTQSTTMALEAGSYVFVCNILESEGTETISHYQQGMRVGFTAD